MKTKKLLALLMAGTMSVSMLSGCGGSAAKTNDSSADATDTSASAESDVDYVKSNGKLVIRHSRISRRWIIRKTVGRVGRL